MQMTPEEARRFSSRLHARNWEAWEQMGERERDGVKQLMREGFDMHTAMTAARHGLRFGRTPQERTRAAVYARGNKWQIENFEATH